MAKIGYARVSTRGQNHDSQVDDLPTYGCERISTDTASGKLAARPELGKALAYLRFISRPVPSDPSPPLARILRGGGDRGGATRLKLYVSLLYVSLLWLAR